MTEKIDFKKEFKAYYSPKVGKPEIITPPVMQFLMIDGQGDPNTSKDFEAAIGALYSIMYGVKFGRKKAGRTPDFSVGALEGLWWNDSGEGFSVGEKDGWLWTIMMWAPDFITNKDIGEQVEILKVKKPNPALGKARLEKFDEGLAVQILHIGPYDTEPASVEKMHAFAAEQGYTQSGKHHEIYLGDPRRAAPDKLKTIIRHPITKSKEKS